MDRKNVRMMVNLTAAQARAGESDREVSKTHPDNL